MFRLLAPAGAPIYLSDIVRTTAARLHPKARLDRLQQTVSKSAQVGHCHFVDSGRTALMVILKALKSDAEPNRCEVIIPAYTCFTVPAAVIRAGLKVRPVDIDPQTMDYDYVKMASLDFRKVLAVVGTNLFGIVSDWKKLRCLSREKGISLIDDAAQSMGSSFDGRPSGSLGRAGFYSLGRGKNLSTYTGGVLLENDDRLAENISEEVNKLPGASFASELALLAKMAVVSIFGRPRLYWLPASMPFLGLGDTVFEPDFPAEQLSLTQQCLLDIVYDRLDHYNNTRRRNASALAESISGLPDFTVPGLSLVPIPAYLRLPILATDSSHRNRAITALKQIGVTASAMYPSIVSDIPGIEPYLVSNDVTYPGAQNVVDQLLAVPTHPYVTERDIKKITATLAQVKAH